MKEHSIEDLNEIYICLDAVKKQAANLKKSFKIELTRVLVHGILHLLGFNHEKGGKKAQAMKDKEEKILNKIHI